MASRASIRGKQPSVQEGSFLLFLRSVGYKEDLPPSTVAWLESAPVFKFLASRLSHDNFVAPEDQQEYNEIMLARGPTPELYEALGDSGSEADDEEGSQQQIDGHEWLAGAADVQQQLQDQQEYVQILEQEISSLRALSAQGESIVRNMRSSSRQESLARRQALASQDLNAVKAELHRVNSELNDVLQGLADVCSKLATLLQDRPQQWLLSVADLTVYQKQDEEALRVFNRAMGILNAAGVVRQLDPTASPAAENHRPNPNGLPGKPAFQSALTTPQPQKAAAQQQQQVQGLPLLTPRMRRTNRAEALLDADIKRHAEQESRNAALLRELMRQRLAFKLGFDHLIKAEVAEAGMKAQLAAAHDVRSKSGGFARYRNMGPDSVGQLSVEVSQLEEKRQLLYNEELPGLTEDIARLNDTYIVAGDYDRQLRKMAVAADRKQAVLSSLLDTTSRHLLLLMIGSQELQRLQALQKELQETENHLNNHVDAIDARVNGSVSAWHTIQQLQQRSNLHPDDSYLMALMAAAEGTLSFTDRSAADLGMPTDGPKHGLTNGAADGPTALQQEYGSFAAPVTPVSAAAGFAQTTPQSAKTPRYMPVKHLTDQLKTLSTNLQQSSTHITQLITDLPQQLDQHALVDQQLHELAYPGGQSSAQLVPNPGPLGGLHSSSGGGSSIRGLGSAIGSSAAPSVRSVSVRSASSGATSSSVPGQHPLPLLRVPEVAEAQAALDKANKALGTDMQKIVQQLGELQKIFTQNKKELDMQRKVMTMFFTRPHELSAYVNCLREELTALDAARDIQ